ncbi:MAG: hypothetical protein EU529_12310 [Promethearchaeota archaeon]|nr:MAG: hypothetical protein EU529_12310 [Candidatus Lokiarchaeota archaeon]
MLIDPKVTKLSIFNGGGGIVEREIKLSLSQGTNEFEIANVPASFDPNSADIKLEYVSPTDKDLITLQQTIVSLPDANTSQQIIDREKSAATNIITYSIDFTRELRERVSEICEASSYRTYADMKGTFNFIINSKINGEVIVKILYFIADLRIKWETTLQVNINDDGKSAEIEAYLVVDNQTGFSYEDVELGFAIFELPRTTFETTSEEFAYAQNIPMEQQAFSELSKQKRTQRMRNLML